MGGRNTSSNTFQLFLTAPIKKLDQLWPKSLYVIENKTQSWLSFETIVTT